jgi:hydroxymethylpyrimidine pyrophosphatase-like HAD family hydrolase
MGKPFRKEIAELESTYNWACAADVSKISNVLKSTWDLPLISVGSGGSFSAAELQVTLHRTFFQSTAQAVTPMELVSSLPRNGRASVWLMSASGNNIDVRRAYQHAAIMEPKAVSGIVGKSNSKLSGLAAKHKYTNLFEYILPSGKDGFLATNSLFGFATLLYRGYCKATKKPENLPNSLSELVSSRISKFQGMDDILLETKHLWTQNTVHVIYSPALKAAAYDIESKFVEAGLGSIHLADLRNFAHGRHHWFSKNESGSGILVLSTLEDSDLGARTLGCLPEDIPKSHIVINDEMGSGAMVGLLLSIHFTNCRGEQRNIDPGKPGVPPYGSKIYRLTASSGFVRSIPKKEVAVRRKSRSGPILADLDQAWDDAYRKFSSKLLRQKFGGIVLDYDGTLVDSRNRGEPPTEEICRELERLLEAGIKIGFATGRGKSIREELQRQNAISEKYWQEIIIGYYNGSDIGYLSDSSVPNGADNCSKKLAEAFDLLRESPFVGALEHEIDRRQKQVTIQPKAAFPETFLWDVAKDQLSQGMGVAVETVRSSHSIDILEPSVTKLSVVDKISSGLSEDVDVLTIGDRGCWPGNDTALLSAPFSLSVDEVSFSKDKCWNLCSAGVKGPQGALEYLRRLSGENGVVRFK